MSPDQTGGVCEESARHAYLDVEDTLSTTLREYVGMYVDVQGSWSTRAECVDGREGDVAVSMGTAATEDMEVVTYEGDACGDGSGSQVVGDTDVAMDSTVLDVSNVVLEANIGDGTQWAVIWISGETADGMDVDIEMSSEGELRGSTVLAIVAGNEKEVDQCTLTEWAR
jgi:hypothetical protein